MSANDEKERSVTMNDERELSIHVVVERGREDGRHRASGVARFGTERAETSCVAGSEIRAASSVFHDLALAFDEARARRAAALEEPYARQTAGVAALNALVAERVSPVCAACGAIDDSLPPLERRTLLGLRTAGQGQGPVLASLAEMPEGWVVGAFAQSRGRGADGAPRVSVGEAGGAAPFALCPSCFRAASRAVEAALEPLAARKGRT